MAANIFLSQLMLVFTHAGTLSAQLLSTTLLLRRCWACQAKNCDFGYTYQIGTLLERAIKRDTHVFSSFRFGFRAIHCCCFFKNIRHVA